MAGRWGRGGLSTRKHGIGGHATRDPRKVMEALRILDRQKAARPRQQMFASIGELFGRRGQKDGSVNAPE